MKNRSSNFRLLAILVLLVLACNALTGPGEEATDEPADDQPVATNPPVPTIHVDGSSVPVLCTDTQPPFITGFDVYAEPSLPEPRPRVPFRDPVFGTCLVRVTDRKADISPDDSSKGLKNEYSRVQSFNADESLILVRGLDATWYLYDAKSLELLGKIPLEIDPRWSASDPNLIYYFNGTSLISYDVKSGEQVTVHDFASDLPGQNLSAVWTRYEGSPSFDGNTWGLMAEDADWLTNAFLVYELSSDRVIGTLDTRGWSAEERGIDSVTISPRGDYFLAYLDKYCEHGQMGTQADPCGLMVYDRDLKNGRGLLRLIGHSDTAIDVKGRQVLVYQDIDTDNISMLDLESGAITPLWPIDFSHTPIGLHLSGVASLQPGWAVISTHDGDPASYTWMDDQVFVIELKPNGRVIRLAHTHSLVDANMEHDYWAEPQASSNRDLTRILFTSNWGRSGSEEVEMFMIQLPANWLDSLP